MKFTKKALAFAVLAVLLTGCAGWFTGRVDKKDERIAALEVERQEATTDEERARVDEAIEEEKEGRDKAMEGALDEQKNRQALLMALLALGTGGLKWVAGTAAKGAI